MIYHMKFRAINVRNGVFDDLPMRTISAECVAGMRIDFDSSGQLESRSLQANGLPNGQGTSIDTTITTLTAGLIADIGQHWILNYTPSWVSYSATSMRNSFNQSFLIIGATTADDWSLQFSEGFQSANNVIVETAQQTKQHSWATSFSAVRKLGTHSTYEGSVNLDERYAENSPNYRTWSTQQWLKSQVSPKVHAGLGLILGYVDFTKPSNSNSRSEQYLGEIGWKPTDKLDLSIQGGTESRHSQTAGTATLHNPTLQASLQYNPFDHTRVSFTAFRKTSNSYFTNELTKNNGWSAGLNQRLLEKLTLSLNYTHQTSDYIAFGAAPTLGSNAGRSDDLSSFNSSLSVQLFKHWTLAAIYQKSKNMADKTGVTIANYSFSTTQYGLELNARF